MSVVKATHADIAALNLLVNCAYRGETSKKGWTTESHLLDGSRIDEETIAGYFNNPDITLLKYTHNDGQIRGGVYLEKKEHKLYLGMLSVWPEMQDSGIGRALLQEAEKFALSLDIGTIEITVISSRAELIDWYKRRSYEATGVVLPFHVDKKFGVPNTPIELMVMEKKLNR